MEQKAAVISRPLPAETRIGLMCEHNLVAGRLGYVSHSRADTHCTASEVLFLDRGSCDAVQIRYVSGTRSAGHGYGATRSYRYFWIDDIFFPIPAARRQVAGKGETG